MKTIQYQEEADSGNEIHSIREMEEVSVVSDYVAYETEDNFHSEREMEQKEVVQALNVINGAKRSKALEYEVQMENKKVNMECDTGAVISVMSSKEFMKKINHVPITMDSLKANNGLCTISGEKLTEYGKAMVTV